MTGIDIAVNKGVDFSYDILKYITKYNPEYEKDIGMVLISIVGFIMYYGTKNIDTIIKSYKNTKYTTTKKDLETMMKEEKSTNTDVIGLSTPHITLLKTLDEPIIYIDDELTLKKTKNQSNIEHLVNFIHEMNHIIKSQNKRIIYRDNSTLITRNGIIKFQYNISDLSLESSIHRYTEEGLNELQTEDILSTIITLCSMDIKNKYAKRYLDKIRKEIETYNSESYYQGSMSLLNPLYMNNRFKKDYTDGCINGSIQNIFDNFDYYVGNGAFKELTKNVDEFYSSGFQDEPMKKVVELVVNYQYSKRK